MSAFGQKRTYAVQQAMSALHPIARQLAGHISHRHRLERGNCGLGSVTLFVDLQVGWREVGKDSAQRVQPTCLAGCKAAHRTSLAAVVETITECATTNDRLDCHDLGDRFIVEGTKARWDRLGLAIPCQNLGI
jgi:hypothetical protein